ALDRMALCAFGRLLSLADSFDRSPRGRLRELARHQVVAQVALGDVYHRALGAQRLHVRQQNRFWHGLAVVVAAFAARAVVATALVDVRQQCELTRALDSARDLHLMAAAGAGDAPGADLALLRDEPAQGRHVLVVDLLDLVAAVLAGLAPPAARASLLVATADGLAATACLGHQKPPTPRRGACSRELRLIAFNGPGCAG